MSETPAQRAVAASIVSLVVAVAAVMAYLPPLAERLTGSVMRAVLFGLLLASAALLHWVFLGIAARRMGRSILGWVSFAVLLFPIGGATALILFNWLADESPAPAPSRAPYA